MVSTPLKNISQNGNLPQIGVKIKNIWNHHLVILVGSSKNHQKGSFWEGGGYFFGKKSEEKKTKSMSESWPEWEVTSLRDDMIWMIHAAELHYNTTRSWKKELDLQSSLAHNPADEQELSTVRYPSSHDSRFCRCIMIHRHPSKTFKKKLQTKASDNKSPNPLFTYWKKNVKIIN